MLTRSACGRVLSRPWARPVAHTDGCCRWTPRESPPNGNWHRHPLSCWIPPAILRTITPLPPAAVCLPEKPVVSACRCLRVTSTCGRRPPHVFSWRPRSPASIGSWQPVPGHCAMGISACNRTASTCLPSTGSSCFFWKKTLAVEAAGGGMDSSTFAERWVDLMLASDPLLQGFSELAPAVQVRERGFMINSVKGFAGYLASLKKIPISNFE